MLTRFSRYLSIAGSVILLGAWLVQQFAFDDLNDKLRRLNGAEAVFYQYRANNALFVSLRDIAGADKDRQIAESQTRSYMIGAAYLRQAISPPTYERAFEKFQDQDAPEKMTPDAKRLQEFGVLELALNIDRENLSGRKMLVQIIFWLLNILGTVMVITGAIAKLRLESKAGA